MGENEVKKIATREAYGNALVEIGAKDPRVVALDADLAGATKSGYFKKAFPDRFYNCGIAEQNMIGVAAGLASCGKIPFASSFAMFATGRAYEQIRNSVAYPRLNVKICASHAGVSVGEDGATHQCIEDISLMRGIPGMVVLNPSDYTQAKAAVYAAYEYDGPVYIRFGRLAVPVIYGESERTFEIGKAVVLSRGKDVNIISTGMMLTNVLAAQKALKEQGIDAGVIDMPSIKPIDKAELCSAAELSGALVTVEEHNIIGGLGSAVCEAVCEEIPVPVVRVGVLDTFGRSGNGAELIDIFGMGVCDIVAAAKRAIEIKNKKR